MKDIKSSTKIKVILVHGIFDDGRVFKKMQSYLEGFNCDVFVPSLKPATATRGIIDLSNKLKRYIDTQLLPDEEFILVGFSMGCLVSRYYLQELGGDSRCNVFHAISGPHKGSLLAHLFWGQGAKDLRPNSHFLQQLQTTEHTL